MADGISIGELREALVSATDLGGAFGGNLHESAGILLRDGDGVTRPLAAVSAAFIGGAFVLVLDGHG